MSCGPAPGSYTPARIALRIGGLAGAALAVLLVAVLLGIAIGETPIAVRMVYEVLSNKLLGSGHDVDPINQGIVWNYRLPRALVAASCGAGLAISGVVLQSLLRNAELCSELVYDRVN